MDNWRSGNSPGTLYVLEEKDLYRVGDCWMKGRLLVGDVVLCTEHSGDCFDDYVLIKPFYNGLKAILGATFGAYVFGKETEWQPTAREYHLLMAGEIIWSTTEATKQHPLSIEVHGKS